MYDATIAALDAQAERVAEWLAARLEARDRWLDSELSFEAMMHGFDLSVWRAHPAVCALGIAVEEVVVPWCERPLVVLRRREDEETEPETGGNHAEDRDEGPDGPEEVHGVGQGDEKF